MNQHSPRGRAIARQDEQIAQNVAKIEEQKARPTAIQAMAGRYNMSPALLRDTLRQTVFRDANDAEFAALIVVADQYKLNPLTKEIYAFRQKGGGIMPMVAVDGWIRIMNEHPQFDSIEFDYIFDNEGKLECIEAIIHRKDRSRPTKVPEYMDECVRNTDPWKQSPKRMLRHRALMQCARVAFGFSDIGVEGDYEVIPGGDLEPMQAARMPSDRELTDQRSAPSQVYGTDAEDEDTARALDAGYDPETGEFVDQQQDGPDDTQRGESHNGTAGAAADADWDGIVAEFRKLVARKETIRDVEAAWTEFEARHDDMPDAVFEAGEAIVNERTAALRKK